MTTSVSLMLLLLGCMAPLIGAMTIQPEIIKKTAPAADGTPITYLYAQAQGESRDRRSLIVLAPGAGDEAAGMMVLKRYFLDEASRRGWSVAVPVVPAQEASVKGYFRRRADGVVAVADAVAVERNLAGNQHCLVGISNGGLDALVVASTAPGRFSHVVVMPGALDAEVSDESLTHLRGKAVTLLLGEEDEAWMGASAAAARRLKAAGALVVEQKITNSGHILAVNNAALFDVLAGDRSPATLARLGGESGPAVPGVVTIGNPPLPAKVAENPAVVVLDFKTREVASVLDGLHDAAAKADEERYFAIFTPDAVFLGTDISERWTYAQFRAWAKPYFQQGQGWAYTARSRSIFFGPSGDTAWFDEFLDNKRLGECRGTGVLVKSDGVWRVAQYHLALPVPNDLADDLVKRVRLLQTPVTK